MIYDGPNAHRTETRPRPPPRPGSASPANPPRASGLSSPTATWDRSGPARRRAGRSTAAKRRPNCGSWKPGRPPSAGSSGLPCGTPNWTASPGRLLEVFGGQDKMLSRAVNGRPAFPRIGMWTAPRAPTPQRMRNCWTPPATATGRPGRPGRAPPGPAGAHGAAAHGPPAPGPRRSRRRCPGRLPGGARPVPPGTAPTRACPSSCGSAWKSARSSWTFAASTWGPRCGMRGRKSRHTAGRCRRRRRCRWPSICWGS
jgi:hypothetical protein